MTDPRHFLMKNIGTLTTQGMIETDRTILKIMLEKQFSKV